jgi:hypothetical protein
MLRHCALVLLLAFTLGPSGSTSIHSSGARRAVVSWTTATDAQNLTIPYGTVAICSDDGCNIRVQNIFDLQGSLVCQTSLCKISITASSLTVGTQGLLNGGDINVTVAGNVSIAGTVSSNGLGYGPEQGEGKGEGPPIGTVTTAGYHYGNGGGAGHGGQGSSGCGHSGFSKSGSGGTSYGSASRPQTFGSGGVCLTVCLCVVWVYECVLDVTRMG